MEGEVLCLQEKAVGVAPWLLLQEEEGVVVGRPCHQEGAEAVVVP